jgi:hypothetical protein
MLGEGSTIAAVLMSMLVGCAHPKPEPQPQPSTTKFKDVIPAPHADQTESERGSESWNMKTGTDDDAGAVPLGHAEPTTIADLLVLPKPAHVPNDWPRQDGTERTVYVLKNITIKDYKIEGGDKGVSFGKDCKLAGGWQ